MPGLLILVLAGGSQDLVDSIEASTGQGESKEKIIIHSIKQMFFEVSSRPGPQIASEKEFRLIEVEPLLPG
jgi:hypothetical protein